MSENMTSPIAWFAATSARITVATRSNGSPDSLADMSTTITPVLAPAGRRAARPLPAERASEDGAAEGGRECEDEREPDERRPLGRRRGGRAGRRAPSRRGA